MTDTNEVKTAGLFYRMIDLRADLAANGASEAAALVGLACQLLVERPIGCDPIAMEGCGGSGGPATCDRAA